MAIPPLLALKAAGTAQGGLQKTLTGDIYSRKWTEVRGKGNKAVVVEHEAHLNPAGLGMGILVLGGAAVTAAVALWAMQLRVQPIKIQKMKTIVDAPEIPAHTVEDYPAIWNWVTIDDEWVAPVEVNDAFLGVRCTLDGAENTLANPAPNGGAWYSYHRPHGLETLYGTRWRAGYMKTHKEYQITTPAVTHEEPFVPAVTHEEPDGDPVKKFSLEQRRGFSVSEIFDDLKDSIGLGKPLLSPAQDKLLTVISPIYNPLKKLWGGK